MSVLDPERVSPRSAVRYRPLPVTDQAQPGPLVARRSRVCPDATPPATKVAPDALPQEEEGYPPPWRRADAPAPRRKATHAPMACVRRRVHPLLFIGVSLLAFVLVWIGVTQALIWGTNAWNDLHYGYPRTFQIDAVVGHQDSPSAPSHFLAINLRGQIEVVEWPGGSAAHARVYLGPQLLGPGSDLEPVTLRFVDLTGTHLPDMVITVQGEPIILLNDRGGFRSLRPEEQGPLLQRLRQLGQ